METQAYRDIGAADGRQHRPRTVRRVVSAAVVLLALLTIGWVLPPGLHVSGQAAPNTPSSGGPVYNVLDYGAIPDDKLEDTQAIEQAIKDAAFTRGTVFVPAGEYVVGSLKLPSGVTIAGESGYRTRLVLKDSLGGDRDNPDLPNQTGLLMSRDFIGEGNYTTDVSIRDLALYGNSANQWGGGPLPRGTDSIHGVSMLAARGWVVQRVWAEDFDGDGFYIGGRDNGPGAANNRLEDCVSTRNIRNGLTIVAGEGNIIRGCKFYENQRGIIKSTPKFSPRMYKAGEVDLEPNNPARQTARWNVFEYNRIGPGPGDGFVIAGTADTSGNIIRNNVFIDVARYQFVIWSGGSDRNRIENNQFIATRPYSVVSHLVIGAAEQNCIIGNTFHGGSNRLNSAMILIRLQATDTAILNNELVANNVYGDGRNIVVLADAVDTYISQNELTGSSVDARGRVLKEKPGFCQGFS